MAVVVSLCDFVAKSYRPSGATVVDRNERVSRARYAVRFFAFNAGVVFLIWCLNGAAASSNVPEIAGLLGIFAICALPIFSMENYKSGLHLSPNPDVRVPTGYWDEPEFSLRNIVEYWIAIAFKSYVGPLTLLWLGFLAAGNGCITREDSSWVIVSVVQSTVYLAIQWFLMFRNYERGWRIVSEQRVQASHETQRRAQEENTRREMERAERAGKEDAQKRRTNARATAVLTYACLVPKLGNRFTQEMLDRYFKEFMGEDHSAEDVERRGRELLEIVQKLAVEEAPTKPPMTFADLTAWYLHQKEEIERMQVDERLKRSYLADLNKRYRELASLLLEKLEP